MPTAKRHTTSVSAKGQVTLPKAIREQRHWEAGTILMVEDRPEGVLLRSAPLFEPTRPEDVFGVLSHFGRPKSLRAMSKATKAEARQRHARD